MFQPIATAIPILGLISRSIPRTDFIHGRRCIILKRVIIREIDFTGFTDGRTESTIDGGCIIIIPKINCGGSVANNLCVHTGLSSGSSPMTIAPDGTTGLKLGEFRLVYHPHLPTSHASPGLRIDIL